MGTALIKAKLEDKDLIAIGLAPINKVLQTVSVAKIQAQSVGNQIQVIGATYDGIPYPSGVT